MRVLLDEDLPRSLSNVFTEFGFEVFDVWELGIRGCSDAVVFRAAQRHDAMLVTADLGFANVLRFPPRRSHGIIVLRFPSALSVTMVCREIRKVLRSVPTRSFRRKLTVVEVGAVRFRA